MFNILDWVRKVCDWIVEILERTITFLENVKKFFEKLKLDRKKENPFVIDGKLFRKLLHQAPVQKVGIFEAVYDEEFDEIFSARELQSEGIDQETKDKLAQGDGMVLVD